jgi:hypothetical protein
MLFPRLIHQWTLMDLPRYVASWIMITCADNFRILNLYMSPALKLPPLIHRCPIQLWPMVCSNCVIVGSTRLTFNL